MVVRHADYVACPSDLGLARDGDDAGGVCLLEDFCVWDFVLLADVEEFPETSEVKVI